MPFHYRPRPQLAQRLSNACPRTAHLKPLRTPIRTIVSNSPPMAATAIPSQNFTLDRKIWNSSLYASVHDFWFQGLDLDAKVQNATTKRRWWGLGRSDEEFGEIDRQVLHLFGPAVHSIGPETLYLPEWKGYEFESERVGEIAAPFIKEVEVQESSKDRADILLALILLLDQMPRHIFRAPKELQVVYRHYDRLAWSLFRSFKKSSASSTVPLEDNPLGSSWYHARLVRKNWFQMPLIHSEDLASQGEAQVEVESWQHEAREKGNEEVVEDLAVSVKAFKDHRDIVERFGRFPHRNRCLGREDTVEEEEWLKTGETFGVKQGGQ